MYNIFKWKRWIFYSFSRNRCNKITRNTSSLDLIRKEDDNFDRRKKTGTTRSSDIWSLRCLFYELLTGKFLFEEIQDYYMGFIAKIDNNNINDLLTIERRILFNHLIKILLFI